MKNIKIEIGEILPNPFKKHINGGKLDRQIVDQLKDSFETTRFHHNLLGRYDTKGEVELCNGGHHRLQAAKELYGNKYSINMNVYDNAEYSDELMAKDLILENWTQRGTDFRDTEASILLAKKLLSGEIKGCNVTLQLRQGKRTDLGDNHIGAREIANFLSKKGHIIKHNQIAKYLNIAENLDEDIHDKIKKGLQGHTGEGNIGLELGAKIAQFDKKEQKEIFKAVEKTMVSDGNAKGLSEEKVEKLLTKYKEAPEKVKAKVRKGDIDLDDVEDETYVEKLKENHKGEKSTFIPSFRERLCELDNQLIRLEQSVGSFDTIFNSKEFMERYLELDVKYQKDFNGLVMTIHDRMQGLTKTVSSFMGKFF